MAAARRAAYAELPVMKLCAVTLVLTLGIACIEAAHPATNAPGPSPTSSHTACERAWQEYAAIDDFHDSYRAATPTLFECRSLDEWIAVGRATPGHSLLPARFTATNICRYEEEVRSAPVCRSL
jgi:hypothetical protein